MKDVIGIKIVDFFATQVGSSDNDTTSDSIKYIDILSPDIPTIGHILDERMPKILYRVPLERNFDGISHQMEMPLL